MRFMMMHKQSADEEKGIPPSAGFMAGMGQLIEDALKAEVFVMGEGLKSSHHRVRLNFTDGKSVIKKGPYAGNNELVAGFALLKVQSMDEAIDWSTRFTQVISEMSNDVEVEIGAICEPWDLGFAPKPEAPTPLRYLVLHKANNDSESGAPPSPEMISKMGALIAEMQKAGILIATEGLKPSSQALRVTYKAGERTATIDGPFAESKELIAGFSMFKLDSMEDALRWTDRFGALFAEVEVDIRPL